MTSENELIDVAVSPVSDIPSAVLDKAAAVLNKDAYTLRLILALKVPRVIAQYPTIKEAEMTAVNLNLLGFVPLIYRHSELQRPLNIFKAAAIQPVIDGVIFEDNSGKTRRLETKKVFLIVKGVIQTMEEHEKISNVKKINITATLITGGIPISRTERKKTTETSSHTTHFLRIFENNNTESCIEIRHNSFNYAYLGPAMKLSSMQNFNLTVIKLKELFTETACDDKLSELLVLKYPPTSNKENIDFNCRLIYMYHQEIKKRESL